MLKDSKFVKLARFVMAGVAEDKTAVMFNVATTAEGKISATKFIAVTMNPASIVATSRFKKLALSLNIEP